MASSYSLHLAGGRTAAHLRGVVTWETGSALALGS